MYGIENHKLNTQKKDMLFVLQIRNIFACFAPLDPLVTSCHSLFHIFHAAGDLNQLEQCANRGKQVIVSIGKQYPEQLTPSVSKKGIHPEKTKEPKTSMNWWHGSIDKDCKR